MNIPNAITLLRIILVPVYLYFFYTSGENHLLYAGIVFIAAGISDVLDGYIARKYELTTKTGAALDPLADKLMTFAVLISLTTAKLIPTWVLLIMGIKEIAMISGGVILYLFKGNKVVPSNKFGKIATVSFYAAVLSIVFKFPYYSITKILIVATVSLNLIAFINYLLIYLTIREDGTSI